MERMWGKEEYSHGYMIPIVALYLLWLKVDKVETRNLTGSWFGPLIVIGALGAFLIGELSSIYQIMEYGFLLALFGVIIAMVGWKGFHALWVPFIYLFFMVPLPEFLYQNLSGSLQLISSELGVAVIRFFGVSVFLAGNVIDLGIYQLQVAEACNGLRYLFPLMSFGFLCGALYQGPWWQKIFLFLSTIPITILMNSFRIAVIGFLVNSFGIEQAEGFLHYFEGWIVFMMCVGTLFAEIWFFARLHGKTFMDVFVLGIPPTETLNKLLPQRLQPQLVASAVILGLGVVMAFSIQSREDKIPERDSFAQFPLTFGPWSGSDGVIEDQSVLKSLAADDYLLAQYRNVEDGGGVGLWIAYYADQRSGRAVHSPKACLPGGGWMVESIDEYSVKNVGPSGEDITVNRAVILKGEMRQLAYFWFVERGRVQTNEYAVKWMIFWDALTMNRTDGALIRYTTPVAPGETMAEADRRIQSLIASTLPQFPGYIPN
jgi:exosortase D (VPLPA-CTERM-specific)